MAYLRRWFASRAIMTKILIINCAVILVGSVLGIGITERVMEEGRFSPLSYILIAGFALTVGAALNYAILKVAFRPLESLQRLVRQVHAGNLRARAVLERNSDPDIGHFGNALNVMLERMEANARTIEEDQRRLRWMAAQLITAQEDERKRVARELHDEASQALTTLIIGLDSALEAMPARLTEPRRQILALKTLTESTLDEVRNLALSLRPTLLDDLGLASAVRWYGHGIREKSGLDVRVEIVNLEERLPTTIETAVFRIVQEALANAARHAAAKSVAVRLERFDHTVELTITDDGQGFDAEAVMSPDRKCEGLGLFGIEERVTILGGRWELDSAAGRGTTLKAWIPLDAVEHE